ncbi:hypothetical protein [Desulfoluna sp.]|uniref:hypothetical protein n=1 Tax=Desulfoluna sp. TaxID=2045199 RepID=UPI00262FFF2B|nr:hypothetical protein [Desulfoluna sp.]
MFFLGVYLEEGEGTAQVVVVEKCFFSGTKRYRIAHVERVQASDGDGLKKAVLEMRLDERWTAVKKVFSQSGRPPKIKKEPPLILLSSWNDEVQLAEALRRRCASVEVLLREAPDERVRNRLKADAFDNCHVVSTGMMVAALGKTLARGSLNAGQLRSDLAAPLSSLAGMLLDEPERCSAAGSSLPWLSALGSCVWHGESIRRIKRY